MVQKKTMDLEIFKSAEARKLAHFIQISTHPEAAEQYLELLYKICVQDVTPAPDWYEAVRRKEE